MGGNSSKGAPTYYTNESYNSTRNILENLAKDIKGNVSNDAKKKGISLKGYLRQAKFHHPFSKERPYYNSPRDLDYRFHTNVWKDKAYERDPCYGRQAKNNSNLEGAVCTNSKIKGNENKISDTGACAPYRRIHLCDYNLEHIHEGNVLTTDDLLGNVLVMAKSEGASIVNSQANNGTLNVCTAIARSFADIGDIIRGKDLYLGKNESEKKTKGTLQGNLEKIFKKFKEKYGDLKDVPIDDIREYWWALNRKDVWKALTLNAPNEAQYFINLSTGKQSFSNEYCGHHNNDDPLTNLDYVPQFLRWFEEWAEHFCLVRKYKLEKVKEACRGKTGGMYCSHNGCDCEKTIGKIRHFVWDHKCNKCSIECGRYENWMKDQKMEFQKQVKKYEREINGNNLLHNNTNNSINNKYNKDFYKLLEKDYKTVNEFIKLLNEGRYCKEKLPGEEVINFTKADEKGTFSRSQYCQVCPDCGVDCSSGTCIEKKDDINCGNKEIYESPHGVKPIDITVLYSGNEEGEITKRLSEFCTDSSNNKGKNYENWQCYYKNGDDNKCQMTSLSQTDEKHRYVMTFHKFFNFWVRSLLIDTINWETDLRNCLNNTGITDCDNECNKNCKCFQSWVDKKEIEWKNMKKVFENENISSHDYYNKLNGLFEGYFFEVMDKLNKDETKWNKLKENLKKKIESSKQNRGTQDSEAAIKVLFDHLKENATICKDNNTNEGCDSSKKVTQNPCGKNTKDGSKVINVKKIAQYYKRQAYAEATKRSNGLYKLKGDASKGDYKRKGIANGLKEICNMDQSHSNAESKSPDPCHGKGDRLKIGQVWSLKNGKDTSYGEFYLPKRREHMCTSNLEHLKTSNTGLSNSSLASHSLLGDVLLAANYEAKFIKNKFNGQNKEKNGQNGLTDQETVCRAIRYSFADIGDIIRGRDMWDKNRDFEKLEKDLVKIFGHIHTSLKGKLNGKYNGDPEHKQLRSDWWEANRDQVWNAMKCQTTSQPRSGVDITCDSDHTPLDDYTPQRLRWMTEWAEWYCKAQKDEYGKLVAGCEGCRSKGGGKECWKGDNDCTNCTKACTTYTENIKKWKEQWDKISDKYKKLYSSARVDIAANGGPNTSTAIKDNKEKPVIEFLFELYKENGGEIGNPAVDGTTVNTTSTDDTTPTVYSTAEGYVHQEARISECEKQTLFCKNRNGSAVSGGTEDNEYTFTQPPPEYKDSCGCGNRSPQVVEKKQEKQQEDACEIVKPLLEGKNGKTAIDNCNAKKGEFKWDCDPSKIKTEEKGACMPPRRQKLCVNNLKYFSGISEAELLNAFIECAAIETFFQWHKYKEDKGKTSQNSEGLTDQNELDNQLRKGVIPDDFKRQMYYTFGDYRDFCLGKDIGNDVSDVESKIRGVFTKHNKTVSGLTRETFWEQNKKLIWEGMLCGLSYASGNISNVETIKNKNTYANVKFSDNKTTLEEFAKKPQFLRWMTEWGEEFCKKQKEAYGKLVTECKGCKDNPSADECKNRCKQCKDQCAIYKKFITDWKGQWTIQSNKYDELYKKTLNNTNDSPEEEKHVVKYLKTLLPKNGVTDNTFNSAGKYVQKEGYIRDCQQQTDFTNSGNNNYAFETYPNNYKSQCTCEDSAKSQEKKKDDVCDMVKELIRSSNGGKTKVEGCNPKTNGPYPDWDCTNKYVKTEHNGACIPPRRQKFCTSNLTLQNSIKEKEDIRKHFITCAAIETYFGWLRYKIINAEADKELQGGKIPEGFKRQMYYIFGDYRDIFFGKDISKYSHISEVSPKVITILQRQNVKKSGAKQKSDDLLDYWWKEHGKEIWKGMLCALTNDLKEDEKKKQIKSEYSYDKLNITTNGTPSLEDFANTPQFLRWFTEWSDEFCQEHKVEKANLLEKCKEVDCSKEDEDNKKIQNDCSEQCKNYQVWLQNWKNQYNKQSQQYFNIKGNDKYKDIREVKISTNAYEYLNKALTKICPDESCKCMDGESKDTTRKTDNSHDSHMPKSLDDEPEEVKGKCNCQVVPTPRPPLPAPPAVIPAGSGARRVLPPVPKGAGDEEEEDKDQVVHENQDGLATEEVTKQTDADTPTVDNICDIVKNALTGGDLDDACKQKYEKGRERYTQWKCISDNPTGDSVDTPTTTSSSSTCIPPRRQKLYVYNLKQLKEKSAESELKKAFIECAAVETFFQWHKYKVDKIREEKEQQDLLVYESHVPKQLDDELKSGEIPEEFLRQMFYTLGDYRDIFFGKDMLNDTKNISENITRILDASQSTAFDGKNGDNQRKEWWSNYANDIWEGMLCALSYDTDTKEMNKDIKANLTSPGKNNDYKNVTFPSKSGPSVNIKLENFVQRPTFFRWLEEWGDEFCRKRKHKLGHLKKDCRGEYEDKHCSDDGHICERTDTSRNNIFADLNCPDCEKACTNYKKWIIDKRNEFFKHKKKYENENEKLKNELTNNDYYNIFYEEIIKKNDYSSVEKFLSSFNKGEVCQDNSDKYNTIDFNKPLKTFSPSTYCKTCPLYGVNCGINGCKDVNGKEHQWERVLSGQNNDNKSTTTINVEMIDRTGLYNEDGLKEHFKKSRLFKNVRDQNWICSFMNNGMDVCKLDNFNEDIDIDKYITFKVLIERWLLDFLQGYYITKRKIHFCTEQGENKCSEDSKKNCVCVGKWIKKKKDEWNQINEHFKKREHDSGHNMTYKVRMCLEQDRFLNSFINSMKGDKDIKDFEEFAKCDKDECYRNIISRIEHDFVTKLLDSLEKKIEPCRNKPNETQCNCVQPSPLSDDEEEEYENHVERPGFCAAPPTPPKPAVPDLEETSKETASPGDNTDGTHGPKEVEDKEEKTDKGNSEKSKEGGGEEQGPKPDQNPEDSKPSKTQPPEAPKEIVPEKKVPAPPAKKEETSPPPPPLPQSDPTNDILKNTIPIGIALALGSIAFLFIKKKPKSPVDLLRVLDIHKGEYGMPTKLSPNRYIPYKSSQYKGKSYIYMEGDTDEDIYIGDISSSDITSSESEYEELDINDIYPYQSPKYKTLIEVVLEPSTRDIPSSDTPRADTPTNKPINDEEWNELKHDFISGILENAQKDLPKDNISANTPMNTHPNTLYFDNLEEKPFIMSIHDRDLYTGEEYNYDINMSTNTDNDIPVSSKNDVYSGTELINDSLNSDQPIDIYDEVLKRKENELFGTNHVKHTSTHSVAKPTYSDPITNQLELFHKWLDRHRHMCEKWDKNNKVDILNQLKEKWENDNNSVDTTPSSNRTLNTNVSIQIDMDNPKPINILDSNPDNSSMDKPTMDTMEDDIYYDVNDDDNQPSVDDIPMDHNKVDVPKKVHVEMKILKNTSNGSLEQQFPISDVWNI
ncbi:erythrocyte membrane protein 1, PfEMP1, putative [Plasmodium reichenowi]|uniref:Erythrocyte membrane protein 1, PfEMP1, putative n=1 Tax=Plasmodium reichenowi TaxID=5854 RepID=A0A2P9DT28_PLARE|nr:erythrocyte membrane protein 1, PfEMP1, putative [Plasmodium reichenowi]